MKFVRAKSFWLIAAAVSLLLALSGASWGGKTSHATAATISVDAAADDPILRAMQQEMERSKAQLKMDQVPPPYYIEYRVSDVNEYSASAFFGGLQQDQRMHVRVLRVGVRLGDFKVDSYFGTGMGLADLMPLDDDPIALRRQIWLATDRAYKIASSALAQKQAQLKQFTLDQPVDDFSPATVTQLIEPLAKLDHDADHWREMLRKASAIYPKLPPLQSLGTSLRFTAVNQYFVNSEGSVTRRGKTTYLLSLDASLQAEDGMRLGRSPYYYVGKIAELPTLERLTADTQKALDTLAELRKAPIVEEEYRGPVLFSADAAGDVFAGFVGGNVLGSKPRLGDTARTNGAFASSYKSRVLPEFLSVIDDPTRDSFSGHSLVGNYAVDDEGVKAAPVTVIENGVMTNFLLGRQPIRDFPHSNGHGRAAPGQPANPGFGNLIVEARQPLSPDELQKKLIDMCRDQGKPYGYFVDTLGPRYSPRLLYRIWVKDGHKELVRGAVFNELDTRSLRNDLVAAGSDYLVTNRESSVPNSVVAPSILFDELEVKRSDAAKEKLPQYPPPVLNPAPR